MLEILQGLTVNKVRDEKMERLEADPEGEVVYTILDTYQNEDGIIAVCLSHDDGEFYEWLLETLQFRQTVQGLAQLKRMLYREEYENLLDPRRDEPVDVGSASGDDSSAPDGGAF